MRKKLLVGALVCLLGVGTLSACGPKEPSSSTPTEEELKVLADKLIQRVTIEASLYQQATADFALPKEVLNGEEKYAITWTSNSEAAKVEDYNVKITRPESDQENIPYALTAKIDVQGQVRTKTFEGYVMKQAAFVEVATVNDLYNGLASGTYSKGTVVKIKGYVSHIASQGIYFQASNEDRAFYYYDKFAVENNGLEIGSYVEITGPIETYDAYQFSYKTAQIVKLAGSLPEVKLLTADKASYTADELCAVDAASYAASIYAKQFEVTGEVVYTAGSKPSYALKTTVEGKVEFDTYFNTQAALDKLASLNGKQVKVQVIYTGYYAGQNKHKVGALSVEAIKEVA